MATKKQYNWGIILLGLAVLASVTYAAGYWKLPGSTTTPGPAVTGTVQSGQAFCPASSTLAPSSAPPTGCYNQAQVLSIKLQDFYASAALAASTYSCKIFVLTAAGWSSPEVVAAGAAPTTCTSGLTYLPGTQVTIEVCKDTTPACTAADYSAQKTVMYCPLPSVAGTGICGSGPGAGVVPFSTTPSASTAPTAYFSLPIALMAGQALANNTPDCIQVGFLNGTFVPAAPCTSAGAETVFTKTGSNTCGQSTACNGIFSVSLASNYGTSGTLPSSNPWGNGYSSFTPVDTQTGSQARGQLNVAFVMEIKATTGSDMCTPTQSVTGNLDTILGVTPTVLAKNSATDVFYVWVLPDSAVTRQIDASGNVLQSGAWSQTGFGINCNAVYGGGSTDVVTITDNEYTYFSLNYFKSTTGALNPEALNTINSSSGLALNNVLTIKQ